jgi:predicted nucleotidyltransferase
VKLVEARDLARLQRRLQIYDETRTRLRQALSELLPGQRVVLFGSLTRRGAFNDRSDVDIALYEEPRRMNSWQLTGELMDHLERPVDIVLLPMCRFREKILREGELWTL